MTQLISLAPAPIQAFADIETLGPICSTTAEKYMVTNRRNILSEY